MKNKPKTIGLSMALMMVIDAQGWHHKINEYASKIYQYIQLFFELERTGYKRIKILRRFYRMVDQEIVLNSTNPAGKPISCKKGCAFCCKMNVDIFSIEAEHILDYTREKGIPIDVDYLKKQAGIPDKMEIALHPQISPCVFLKNDNTCGIYEARPFSCRTYQVITAAQKCNIQEYPDFKTGAVIDIESELIISAVASIHDTPDALPRQLLRALTK